MNNAALERLASVTERVQSRPAPSALEQKAPVKEEAYRWKATTISEEVKEEVATPKALKKALEHEKTPELAAKLAEESHCARRLGGGGQQTPAAEAGRAGRAERLERAGRQSGASAPASGPASPQFPRRAKGDAGGAEPGARRLQGRRLN